MASYTCTLAEIGAESIGLVGGKGANLGELTAAGLPVPTAFCVTTEAYRRHIESNALLEGILEILDGADYRDSAGLAARGERIRDIIMAVPVPGEVEAAVRASYAALEAQLGSSPHVSVRSSATAEDLPGMSFAGQQDTYLNIAGTDNVVHHIKRCWASLWTDRAISYRQHQGFAHQDVLLAVVVQQMFPSEVAGVLFTANPVTSNPDELFLNSSWGLGEAIVSGRVNPDQYVVDRKTLAVKDRQILDKQVMTAWGVDGQGSVEIEVPEHKRLAETLTDGQIRELSQIALRVEEHYGFPQDVEWGFDGERFAVLQAREVTAADLDFGHELETWQTPEALAALTDERWLWSRAYSDEVQTGPTTPLFYTEIQRRTSMKKVRAMLYTEAPEVLGYRPDQLRDIPYFRWYCARAYYNADWEIERIRCFIPPFARDEATLWPFPEGQREAIRKMPFNWIRFLWVMAKLHVTNPRVSLLESTHHLYANLERWTAFEAALWAKTDFETATPREILATRQKAVANSGFRENIVLPFTIYLYILPQLLRLTLAKWCGDEDQALYNSMITGLRTPTSQENLAVWQLSRSIKRSPALMALFAGDDASHILAQLEASVEGRAFRAELDAFLKLYGHRGAAERDPIYPRWRHKPEMLFHSIKPMLALGEEDDPNLFEERLAEKMELSKAAALKAARKARLGFLKAPVLKWLIDTTRDYMYYRDFERFHNDKTMAVPRDIYLAIARQFVQRGLMTDPEDIFFLGREEVEAIDAGKLSARNVFIRIRARRRVYEKYTRKQPPKYLRGWHAYDDNALADDGKGMKGIPASSGVVTGRARVCRDLAEISKIEKGDILVTVATDPGWTTVFSIIGGVVVETGGVIAHAVMISREYGVPCVANLGRACDLIPDGAIITVDGTQGRVVIHDAA